MKELSRSDGFKEVITITKPLALKKAAKLQRSKMMARVELSYPNMNIGSWNIQSCNKPFKQQGLLAFSHKHNLHVLGVRETKLNSRTCA